MPTLLLIETATSVCSVALCRKGKVIAQKESDERNAHSAHLAVFIQELFSETSLSYSDLDGVAVSQGPGSYTGLRIGVSSAKGIAYAMDRPLIAIDTLQSLAYTARIQYPNAQYLAMIDARRMEVYAGLYDANLHLLRPIQADIVEKGYYDSWFTPSIPTVIVGDGSGKCASLWNYENVIVDTDITSSATAMAELATEKYQKELWENVAYFEPFYLKDFVAGKPKVKGLL